VNDILYAAALIVVAAAVGIAVGGWLDKRDRARKSQLVRREYLDRKAEVERDARKRL
jgi:hypothetical protein